MKRFSVYFLQHKAGSSWETLERAQSVAVLQSRLADLLGDGGEAEVRLVGAAFDADRREWDYTQIFYIDQASVDLGIGEEETDDWNDRPDSDRQATQDEDRFASNFGGHDTENVVPLARDDAVDSGRPSGFGWDDNDRTDRTAADDFGPEDGPSGPDETDDRPSPTSPPSDREAPHDEPGGQDDLPPWSMPDSDPIPEERGKRDEEGEIAPWLHKASQRQGAAAMDPPPYLQQRRRGLPVLKAIVAALLLVLLLAVTAAAGLLFMREPTTLELFRKIGLEQVTKILPSLGGMKEGAMEAPASEPKMESMAKNEPAPVEPTVVEPLTTGQVVRYLGVDPQLRGRWSAGNCETDYIEFTSSGYRRAAGGQESAELVDVEQTLVDEFTYFLRRSPVLIEHFENLGPNRIRLAGVTTEGGLLPSGPDSPILARCR